MSNQIKTEAEVSPTDLAETIINQLRDMDVPDAGIRAALAKKNFDKKLIEELLPKVKRVSFATDFYAFLVEAPRTEAEIVAKITDPANSDNVAKTNLKHYKAIGKLVLDVRAKIEADLAK